MDVNGINKTPATKWSPLVISWFITPSKYMCYTIVIIVINQLS